MLGLPCWARDGQSELTRISSGDPKQTPKFENPWNPERSYLLRFLGLHSGEDLQVLLPSPVAAVFGWPMASSF